MFDIHCPACQRRYLMSESSIDSFRNTHEGPMASLVCYHGHHLNHYFRRTVNRTVQVMVDVPMTSDNGHLDSDSGSGPDHDHDHELEYEYEHDSVRHQEFDHEYAGGREQAAA